MMSDELSKIEIQFFRLKEGKISPKDFEKWVYESDWLENELDVIEYSELLSFNYSRKGLIYELWKVLKNHVDIEKYEVLRVKSILKKIIQEYNPELEKTTITVEPTSNIFRIYSHQHAITTCFRFGDKFFVNYNLSSFEIEKEEIINLDTPNSAEFSKQIIKWLDTKEADVGLFKNWESIHYYEKNRNGYPASDEIEVFVDSERLRIKKQPLYEFLRKNL